MHLITFFGAQGPVGRGLRDALLAQAEPLLACRYFVPEREVFAAPIREALGRGDADADRQWSMIARIAGEKTADGLFLVNEHYWSSSAQILDGGELYADAEGKSVFIDELFRPQRYTIMIAIDNFAEFFPKLRNETLRQTVRDMPWEAVYELSWYDMVLGLRAACPRAEFVVIRSETFPGNAHHLLRRLLPAAEFPTDESEDLIRSSIRWRGHNGLNDMVAEGRLSAEDTVPFVQSFRKGRPNRKSQLDVGFDRDMVELLTSRYDEDWRKIVALQGDEAPLGYVVVPPDGQL
ncbi:MAG: hypothetical protein AAGA87_15115 [Pseudomonadota bacterium]